MSNTIIKIENLSKKYIIGKQESYYSLRDKVSDLFSKKEKEINNEFWALKDINLEIKKGESVGIIGRNGAGKSTLLKVLSQITPPTTGKITMRGRVASLLEVGTGFNPELTGRENIYLNGAILGMTREEIKRKFDEIVAFAEVEQFLDTPVKRYSSGMYMRLAFAVAAHLESEILIVDEVLAVGDAQFQKKCLGKMNDVTKNEGRTVLFVSHNMGAIEQLCDKVILLKSGKIHKIGKDVQKVFSQYLSLNDHGNNMQTVWFAEKNSSKYTNQYFSPISIKIVDRNMKVAELDTEGDLYVLIEGLVEVVDDSLTIGYRLLDEAGNVVYWSYHRDSNRKYWPNISIGINRLMSLVDKNLLQTGKYTLELIGGLHNRQWLFEPGKNNPTVNIFLNTKNTDSPFMTVKRPGLIAPIITWKNK